MKRQGKVNAEEKGDGTQIALSKEIRTGRKNEDTAERRGESGSSPLKREK